MTVRSIEILYMTQTKQEQQKKLLAAANKTFLIFFTAKTITVC